MLPVLFDGASMVSAFRSAENEAAALHALRASFPVGGVTIESMKAALFNGAPLGVTGSSRDEVLTNMISTLLPILYDWYASALAAHAGTPTSSPRPQRGGGGAASLALSPATRRAVAAAREAAQASFETMRAHAAAAAGGGGTSAEFGGFSLSEAAAKRLLESGQKLRSPTAATTTGPSWYVGTPVLTLRTALAEDPGWAPQLSPDNLTPYVLVGQGAMVLYQALADAAAPVMKTVDFSVVNDAGTDGFFVLTTPKSAPEGFTPSHAGIITQAFLERLDRAATMKVIKNLACVRNVAARVADALVRLADDAKKANANPYTLVHRWVAEALGPLHVVTFPASQGAPRAPELAKFYADVVKDAMVSVTAKDETRKSRRDERGDGDGDSSAGSGHRQGARSKSKRHKLGGGGGGGSGGGGGDGGGESVAPRARTTLYYLANPDKEWDGKWCINHGPTGHPWAECRFKGEALEKLKEAGFKEPKAGKSANQRKSESLYVSELATRALASATRGDEREWHRPPAARAMASATRGDER